MLPQNELQAQPVRLRDRQSFQPGKNPLGKAGTAAVCFSILALAQNDTQINIHTGLTASFASPIIAVVIAIVYIPFLPLLRKLE